MFPSKCPDFTMSVRRQGENKSGNLIGVDSLRRQKVESNSDKSRMFFTTSYFSLGALERLLFLNFCWHQFSNIEIHIEGVDKIQLHRSNFLNIKSVEYLPKNSRRTFRFWKFTAQNFNYELIYMQYACITHATYLSTTGYHSRNVTK